MHVNKFVAIDFPYLFREWTIHTHTNSKADPRNALTRCDEVGHYVNINNRTSVLHLQSFQIHGWIARTLVGLNSERELDGSATGRLALVGFTVPTDLQNHLAILSTGGRKREKIGSYDQPFTSPVRQAISKFHYFFLNIIFKIIRASKEYGYQKSLGLTPMTRSVIVGLKPK